MSFICANTKSVVARFHGKNIFSLVRNCQTRFPKCPHRPASPQAVHERSRASTSAPAIGVVMVADLGRSHRCAGLARSYSQFRNNLSQLTCRHVSFLARLLSRSHSSAEAGCFPSVDLSSLYISASAPVSDVSAAACGLPLPSLDLSCSPSGNHPSVLPAINISVPLSL